MFKETKFQILMPYDEKAMTHNANVFKLMGVKIENVRHADMFDQAGNKVYEVGILVCKAQKVVFKKVKKLYSGMKMYEGLPTLF